MRGFSVVGVATIETEEANASLYFQLVTAHTRTPCVHIVM